MSSCFNPKVLVAVSSCLAKALLGKNGCYRSLMKFSGNNTVLNHHQTDQINNSKVGRSPHKCDIYE